MCVVCVCVGRKEGRGRGCGGGVERGVLRAERATLARRDAVASRLAASAHGGRSSRASLACTGAACAFAVHRASARSSLPPASAWRTRSTERGAAHTRVTARCSHYSRARSSPPTHLGASADRCVAVQFSCAQACTAAASPAKLPRLLSPLLVAVAPRLEVLSPGNPLTWSKANSFSRGSL